MKHKQNDLPPDYDYDRVIRSRIDKNGITRYEKWESGDKCWYDETGYIEKMYVARDKRMIINDHNQGDD